MRIANLAQALGIAGLVSIGFHGSATAGNNVVFAMVPTDGAESCVPAKGRVTITSLGVVENMHVELSGLPKNTDFDLFVTQVPTSPFGLAWYMGDIKTDGNGVGVGDFTGRFSTGTFTVALGSAPAPKVFPDNATKNPATAPIQMYHLGVWFDSPKDAANAGCASKVTPFNSTHHAGVQILNTSNYPATNGPLHKVQ